MAMYGRHAQAEQRWPYSFAWQTLREAGMRHAFGSDWPVVTMNPMLGVHAARNRKPWAAGDPCRCKRCTIRWLAIRAMGPMRNFRKIEGDVTGGDGGGCGDL